MSRGSLPDMRMVIRQGPLQKGESNARCEPSMPSIHHNPRMNASSSGAAAADDAALTTITAAVPCDIMLAFGRYKKRNACVFECEQPNLHHLIVVPPPSQHEQAAVGRCLRVRAQARPSHAPSNNVSIPCFCFLKPLYQVSHRR